MTGAAIVAIVLGIPALAFTFWPLLRGSSDGRTFLPVPPDAREQLLERKRQVLRALAELDFEHEAGHVSGEDYAELRVRYEAEAAGLLTELDRLGAVEPPVSEPPRAKTERRRGWRHPLVLGASALGLVVFGIAIGAGIVRHTAPDPTAGQPMPGSRPLATLEPQAGLERPGDGAGRGSRTAGSAEPGALSPTMLQGMLQAARTSLSEGRYGEAIAAYQAVLKRDPQNVDAISHLGLIVAIGGHTDTALETLDRALAIDPNYAPALLYRGQVLYDTKRDVRGAIQAWERYLRVAPAGPDRAHVERLLAEARRQPAR